MSDYEQQQQPARQQLEEYEQEQSKKTYLLTWAETKLLFIASTGFFIDAYDLFIINIIVPIINYEYNQRLSGSIPNAPLSGGLLKAGANIGCVVGQVFFGMMGDKFGRGKVYGSELAVTIFGTILLISVPNSLSATSIFTWLTIFRIVMGIGIGGDYPNSSGVVSDRANIKRRGLMLTFVFSFQGWGNFIGALLAIIILEIFKSSVRDNRHYGHLDAVWRLLAGLILVPAFITLYQRVRLGESDRMKHVQAMRKDPTLLKAGLTNLEVKNGLVVAADSSSNNSINEKEKLNDGEPLPVAPPTATGPQRSAAQEFAIYFREWRHLKLLLGTALSWFLVDITFYGINLNQSIVIQSIGLANSKEPWQYLFDLAKANVIIAAAGFLPGYYFTMFTIEIFGRKNIQLAGFLANALFLGILAGDFDNLRNKHAAFIVVFALLQLISLFSP